VAVAAIYDIHGNLPALEAVLNDIRQAAVEQIVVGGDVLPGPMPRECLGLLRGCELPVHFIHGNGDREVLACMRGERPASVPEQYWPIMRWTAEQLEDNHAQVLARWPKTLDMHVAGMGEVLFCHASPRNDTDIFTRETPVEALMPLFAETGAALAVCGHSHMQFDRRVGQVRVVNAGSVGMPFGEPGAHWLLLGAEVELRRTKYDLAHAAERIRATSYPRAEEFAARYVLQPPSEREMLDAFRRAEVK
jgi:predicted phosphodiesterase